MITSPKLLCVLNVDLKFTNKTDKTVFALGRTLKLHQHRLN